MAAFKAVLVEKSDAGQKVGLVDFDEKDLMDGDVTVRVEWSTLNYKDGLALTGKAPVVRRWPMIPGIDFAGTVQSSTHPEWKPGDRVVLNGYGLGETHLGGYAEKARVKGDWLVPLPSGMSTREAMAIGTTLEFARDATVSEPRRLTDLAALLQSVVDDMSDAGRPVAMEPAKPIVREAKPAALKRALTNLLDNAVKYGKSARAAIKATPNAIEITIDDDGPGIPEQELARVFEPFYRVEASRGRDTGGVGLGLAIAQSIVQAHGGTLTLANRPTGGIRATVALPV
jgi:hypothetical protein